MCQSTKASTTLFVESTPSLSFPSPHRDWVNVLVVLSDGSLVSCSSDKTVKRWLIDVDRDDGQNNEGVRLVGTYVGHQGYVRGAVEIDKNTFLTAAYDATLKVWNKATCECLRSLETGRTVLCLIKSKDNSRIVCGKADAVIEIRRANNLSIISSIEPHFGSDVHCICELDDGTFVSEFSRGMMKRWDRDGNAIQLFSGSTLTVDRVIELQRDIIVISSWDKKVTILKVSTEQRLHELQLSVAIDGLVKLSEDKFVTGSKDGIDIQQHVHSIDLCAIILS